MSTLLLECFYNTVLEIAKFWLYHLKLNKHRDFGPIFVSYLLQHLGYLELPVSHIPASLGGH